MVEASGIWSGNWKEVGPCTIHCQILQWSDEWALTFVNSKYFIAYRTWNNNILYRFGQFRGAGGQQSKSAAIMPTPSSISLEPNTDRPGMNYRTLALSSPDPQICANDCANDPNCKAFTYVKPEVRGPNSVPECRLKDGVPDPVSEECCVSGVK
jgi:hypothetical protein